MHTFPADYDTQLPSWLRERSVVVDLVDSTNRLAKEWAMGSARSGSIVLADNQSAGKGRMGRTWTSSPSTSVLLSMICDLPDLRDKFGRLAIGTSLAVARTVSYACALAGSAASVSIKWPNDTLIDGKKCAGVLVENVPGKPATFVLGVGINITQTEFADDARTPPTSIRLATGRMISRTNVVAELVNQIDECVRGVTGATSASEPNTAATFGEMLAEYRSLLYGIGRPVSFQATQSAERINGIFRGVSDEGALLIEEEGSVAEYWSGDVSHGTFGPERPGEARP